LDTSLSGASVVVSSTGQLGVVASSARYKQEIRSLGDALDKLATAPCLLSIQSRAWCTHYGLIAEEVDEIMPELVVRDERQQPESVQYQELIPLLLQQVQTQRQLIEQQQAQLDRQAATLAELRGLLDKRFATLDGSAR
jgi:hypothetical protein